MLQYQVDVTGAALNVSVPSYSGQQEEVPAGCIHRASKRNSRGRRYIRDEERIGCEWRWREKAKDRCGHRRNEYNLL